MVRKESVKAWTTLRIEDGVISQILGAFDTRRKARESCQASARLYTGRWCVARVTEV